LNGFSAYRRRARSETGSATAEFSLVIGLLTLLVLGVLQLALALHIRNTLIDAAAEGARYGALADGSAELAQDRTRELITIAVGEQYAQNIHVVIGDYQSGRATIVTVTAPLPLLGLFGPDNALEVVGRAPVEGIQ
jgi:Flp pilus assembly protein TadG